MKRGFRFFATKEDFITLFSIVESKHAVHYCECGSFDDPLEIFKANTMLVYDRLGYCDSGSHIGNQFLVLPKGEKVTFGSSKTLSGKSRYSVYNSENPCSIIIDLHGEYQDAAIVASEASTLHYDNDKAKALFKLFRNACRKVSETSVNGYLIGKNAYSLKGKFRFVTIDIKSPIEYDLQL